MRHPPEIDYWKPALERGFHQVGDEKYSGSLDGLPCVIAMVPVGPGSLGVLLRVDVPTSLVGTLYRRNGSVAGRIFQGGQSPLTSSVVFASKFLVVDGASWNVNDLSCQLIEDLHLEYVQAGRDSIAVLWVSEVPPDGPALQRASLLVRSLVDPAGT
jgi:hypothetical protein